ncbi:MAG: DMT family transporter [Treponema sp.]|nr:DMT family transporter [Treponema sp.]
MINHNNSNKKIVGVFLASLTIFVWGITFVCTKYLLRSFTSFEVLLVRFLIAYISLWVLYPHVLHVNQKKDEILFFCAGMTGVTVYQFLENIAISFTSASNVSIIVSTSPIFTALFAQLFLHEKHISLRFITGCVIALLGIVLVSLNGHAVLHISPKGDILALCSALSWGLYSVFISKINKKGYKALPATRRIFFYAVLCMFGLLVLNKIPGIRIHNLYIIDMKLENNVARFSNFLNWINILFLGMLASAFCFVAWSFVCRTLGTVKVTTGIYLIPVVTIVFAAIALHEPITLMGLFGTVLTIVGLYVSQKA